MMVLTNLIPTLILLMLLEQCQGQNQCDSAGYVANKQIQLCKGSWEGKVGTANLCNEGFSVCSTKHGDILNSLNYEEAISATSGCFAYDVYQDYGGCKSPCDGSMKKFTNATTQDDMGGIGSGCDSANKGKTSCITGGLIVAEGFNSYLYGGCESFYRTTGVACCLDNKPEPEKCNLAGSMAGGKIQLCSGTWSGLVGTADLCNDGYSVCSSKHMNILRSVDFNEAISWFGCYAYDAYQDYGVCKSPCSGIVDQDDMAGFGSGCITRQLNGRSCIQEGKVVVGGYHDHVNGGCRASGLTSGVACCSDDTN